MGYRAGHAMLEAAGGQLTTLAGAPLATASPVPESGFHGTGKQGMTAAKLNELSASDAAAAIAARKITSQDLVRSCLDRIAAREGEVGAWTYLDRDRAMAEARARDGEAPRGPLHGVPVGIKDIIDTADMPTAYGSPIYKGIGRVPMPPAWR